MIKFLLKRAALTLPTFFALMFVTFVAIRMVPGDPVEVRTGERGISPERLAQFRHELGLDQPIWKQFADYVWQLLHGDFGTSVVTNEKVLTEFFALFPATLELSAAAMLFAVLLGVPAGVIAAVKRGSWFDHTLMGAAVTGFSMPIFWWGLLLIMLVSERWGLTPVSGRIDLINYYFEPVTGFMLIDALKSDQPGAFWSALHHLILPMIVLGTVPLAVIARMTRSSMLEVLSEDYVRTAKAKGLSPFRVIGYHALRNALIPVVTIVGLQVGTLLAGAVLTETIFSWPGVGKWLIEAIGRRDYPALQGGILLISSMVIVVNLIIDVLYGAINPRIRHGR
ncbi:peptide ABC transporter permease [Alsobacter metallidurans]|uniref:Peptide ABC transporter permease n=1 Tax=Alsobacter metallidurans TaxID=340221 RepID=A0A917I406_9HYPH|nr:ABC transporter permease subunit [Alsobacter metallidurans]GGH07010.1 peptide ABC transporter permease [Alsobacter metallidurans]